MENNDNKFDRDLKWGKQFEDLIERIFTGNCKIEIKAERDLWKETGNIAIELQCRNKPSGISVTEAEFWIQVLVSNNVMVGAFIFRVSQLKKHLKKLKGEKKLRTVYGGDGERSLLALVPIKSLYEIMIPIRGRNIEQEL